MPESRHIRTTIVLRPTSDQLRAQLAIVEVSVPLPNAGWQERLIADVLALGPITMRSACLCATAYPSDRRGGVADGLPRFRPLTLRGSLGRRTLSVGNHVMRAWHHRRQLHRYGALLQDRQSARDLDVNLKPMAQVASYAVAPRAPMHSDPGDHPAGGRGANGTCGRPRRSVAR